MDDRSFRLGDHGRYVAQPNGQRNLAMKQAIESNRINTSTNWAAVCLAIGIAILFLAAMCVAITWYGAFQASDVGNENNSDAIRTSIAFTGLVLPLSLTGAFFTILGLVFRKPNAIPRENDFPQCPNCGRKNAPTTRICPRCETELV